MPVDAVTHTVLAAERLVVARPADRVRPLVLDADGRRRRRTIPSTTCSADVPPVPPARDAGSWPLAYVGAVTRGEHTRAAAGANGRPVARVRGEASANPSSCARSRVLYGCAFGADQRTSPSTRATSVFRMPSAVGVHVNSSGGGVVLPEASSVSTGGRPVERARVIRESSATRTGPTRVGMARSRTKPTLADAHCRRVRATGRCCEPAPRGHARAPRPPADVACHAGEPHSATPGGGAVHGRGRARLARTCRLRVVRRVATPVAPALGRRSNRSSLRRSTPLTPVPGSRSASHSASTSSSNTLGRRASGERSVAGAGQP